MFKRARYRATIAKCHVPLRVTGEVSVAYRAKPSAMRNAGIALLLVIVASLPSRAQQAQEEITVLEEPTVTFDVAGIAIDQLEILIDGALANDFARQEEGQIVLRLPFTRSSDRFRVVVRVAETGEELLAQTFQFAKGLIFDSEKLEVHALVTGTGRPTSRLRPLQPDYDEADLGYDFQGSVAFDGVNENWSMGAQGAFQGSDDDGATVRPGGSKFDLQEGHVFAAYHDDTNQALLIAGDVVVTGLNQLINQGYQTRGIGLTTSWLRERVTLDGATTFGTDIRGFQHGFGQDDDNQRLAVDLGVDVLRSELLGARVTGSLLSAERPSATNFGIAEIPEAERNRVLGSGIELNLFQGRVISRSNFAWSRYENPAPLGITDFGATKGNAQDHRVDATLWQGEAVHVTVFGGYSLIDPLYRSVQAFHAADRETYEFGGGVSWAWVQLGVKRYVFETNVDESPTLLTTRVASNEGNLSLALETFRQGSGEIGADWVRRLIPSTVGLAVTDVRIDALNEAQILANSVLGYTPADIPKEVTRIGTLNFNWTWPRATTDLQFSASRQDTRTLGLQSADISDEGIGLSQSFFGEIWEITGRVTANRTRDKATATSSRTVSLSAGLDFSLRPEGWPDLTAYVDWQRDVTDLLVTGTEQRNRVRRYGATLDFSKYLPRYRWDPLGEIRPFLTSSWLYQDNDLSDPNFGHFSATYYAVIFSAGIRF